MYEGDTIKNPNPPLTFGRNMKVEWDSQAYWSTVYKSGILKVRFRPKSDYEKYNVRLFDPIVGGVNISKIKGNCVNHTQDTYHIVTYAYTCLTDRFNYTTAPNKYAWCYNDTVLGNGTYPIVFKHTFDRGNLPAKYIEWDVREKNGTEIITTCDVIGYQVNNKKILFENFPFRCWINQDAKCVQCKSTKDGDGKPPIKPGDGTSWCEACIVNGSIVNTCRSDANFMQYWRLS